MKKILVYIEPHPIRNSYVEFKTHALFFIKNLILSNIPDYTIRLFSNAHVLADIEKNHPEISPYLLWPTEKENETISSYFGRWNSARQSIWLDLVRGNGDVSLFYEAVLNRLYQEFDFDLGIGWSDNGALKNLTGRRNIPLINCELGPTREPFKPTFYMDPSGTNGSAAIRDFPFDLLKGNAVPPQTWVAMAESKDNKIDILESLVYPPALECRGSEPWVFIPLQLADDLNTLLHSTFETPISFLESVLPILIGLGYKVIVKGHPASVSRPGNLVAETKALSYARSLGDSVIVIDRHSPQKNTIPLIAGADFICTINSSVGFEAMLLGKKTILAGDAAFDIGGRLKCEFKSTEDLISNLGDEHVAKLIVEVLCRHYLHPMEEANASVALWKAIDLMLKHDCQPIDTAFWLKWVDTFDYGNQYSDVLLREINPFDDFVDITKALAQTVRGDMRYLYGNIDNIDAPSSSNNVTTKITIKGWFLNLSSGKGADKISVVLGDKILAISKEFYVRDDVAVRFGLEDKALGFSISVNAALADLQNFAKLVVKYDDNYAVYQIKSGPLTTNLTDRLYRACAKLGQRGRRATPMAKKP